MCKLLQNYRHMPSKTNFTSSASSEMEKKNQVLDLESLFSISLIIYLVAGIILVRRLQLEGLNANTIGYLTVALEYSRGNFYNAVNGFWPPLISWLMVPFIKLGVTPLLSARIIMLITGFFLLIAVRKFSYRFDISEGVRTAILLAFVPVTLNYITLVFPDLLMLYFLVVYLNILFKDDYHARLSGGILCGVTGALAYLGKHYALPFFVSHFFMINVFHFFRATAKEQRKNIVRNAVAGMVVFTIISGAWIAAMGIKYGYFTIGTAGSYGIAKLGPGMFTKPVFGEPENSDPVYYAGLLKPSYETALSVWDDPSYVSGKYFGHKKTDFRSAVVFYAEYAAGNAYRIIVEVCTRFFSLLSLPILLVYVFLCIKPLNKLILRSDILFPVFTIILYTGGLTIVVVSDDTIRYFWLDNILLFLMGGHILTVLFRSEFFSAKARQNVLLVFLIGSFLFVPFKDIVNKPSRGENNYIMSKEIERQYNIKGNIASNDRWGDTLQLTYYLNMDKVGTEDRIYYYGMPKKNQGDVEMLKELKSHDIQYYLVWNGRSFLPGYQDITKGSIQDLKIYSLE